MYRKHSLKKKDEQDLYGENCKILQWAQVHTRIIGDIYCT